jgi:heme A synthase
MKFLGWPSVGLIYGLMLSRSFANSYGSGWLCPRWPLCDPSVTPFEGTWVFLGYLLVFSLLIGLACTTTWGNPVAAQTSPKVRRLAFGGLIGVFVQMILGSSLKESGAGLSCPSFPGCGDHFLPDTWTHAIGIAFLHRWWGILLLGHLFALALNAARSAPELALPTRRVFALSVAQVFFGIGVVLSGLSSNSRVFHAAAGYAIWGLLTFVVIRSGGAQWLWTPFAKLLKTQSSV